MIIIQIHHRDKHYRDKPPLDNNGTLVDFPANNNNSSLFDLKKLAGRKKNDGTKNIKIMVSL